MYANKNYERSLTKYRDLAETQQSKEILNWTRLATAVYATYKKSESKQINRESLKYPFTYQ